MGPVEAIKSVGILVESIKRAREVAERLQDAEMRAVLLDAQERALNLKEQLLNLRTENAELRERLEAKAVLSFDGGAYWTKTSEGRDGPFCSRCQDVERRLVRLRPGYNVFWHCPECKQEFAVTSAPPNPS
ncbi:MAG: hypothetical protein ABR998_10410 [Gemmatimonadales bacterium]